MSSSPSESLAASLAGLDVDCERTTAAEFQETLTAHLRSPSVGVPLDGLDVSLSGTDVAIDPTPSALRAAHTGVTPASFAIADYGSIVLPSTTSGLELVSLYTDRHVAVLDEADILPDMDAAFDRFGASFRADAGSEIIATGPSATADMGALVRGAHGPREVHVIIVEDEDD